MCTHFENVKELRNAAPAIARATNAKPLPVPARHSPLPVISCACYACKKFYVTRVDWNKNPQDFSNRLEYFWLILKKSLIQL